MFSSRTSMSALGTAALVAASVAATTSSGSAAQPRAVNVCELRVFHVKALDLQEDAQGNDEIFLRLGDFRSTTRRYTEGQKRNVSADDVFVGSEPVRLVEQDGGTDDVLASESIPCVQRLNQTSILGNADAIYKLTWQVRVL